MARDWKLPRKGSCRCGALAFEVTTAPMITAACHCRGCQKMASSAYSLTMMVPEDGFAVTSGEPVLGGMKGEEVQHFFCPSCLTWVFSKPQRIAGFVNLRATMLDDTGDIAPFIETWTDERLPFAETGAPKSFPQFPPPDEFGPLLQAFAAWEDGSRRG
ncbi:GFA family protein [Jiella pacifica]|uniref:Aldehyde-activating protein n=1 Tax=Jiella pacifica TaxID=2696469 RepID=A0A6N9TC27_9HYPH|nr:GFA family protein [Jiella pacifica]NDW07229.1 aldehyde-activating protein [Jiella pacifica]